MQIAIDISPLKSGHFLQHRVRGTGFYIDNLKRALLKYYPDNQYTFFTRGEDLPKNIDLIHYPYFEPFFLTLPFKKIAPTVVTVHDLIPLVFPKHFPRGIRGKIKWQIQKWALGRADTIITDSENSKRDIAKYPCILGEKIRVVYLAPGEEFRKMENGKGKMELRKKYRLPPKFFLYVGDATWNKNLPRLIEAVKRLNVPLVMVGKALVERNFDRGNPWNQDLVSVQKLCEGDKQIIRLGFVPQDDLVMIYNLATVFVIPSIYEGFGLPVLEAMACGTPVVCSNTSSLPEVAGEAAIFVDPYSVESIARGISQVYDIDINQYIKLGEKSLAQAKKFSWKKTAQETVAVYKKVLVR